MEQQPQVIKQRNLTINIGWPAVAWVCCAVVAVVWILHT